MSAETAGARAGKEGGSMLDGLEKIAKPVAASLALIAVVAFFIPPVGTAVRLITAWRFGAVGALYYEVDANGNPECETNKKRGCSDLALLREGDRTFDRVGLGDTVQAGSKVNFREKKLPANREYSSNQIIFRLKEGDCAIVFSRLKDVKFHLKKKRDDGMPIVLGGWLKVGTTSCGLFD